MHGRVSRDIMSPLNNNPSKAQRAICGYDWGWTGNAHSIDESSVRLGQPSKAVTHSEEMRDITSEMVQHRN
jgi:hypothetical protein